jgi:hypothetical protein
MAAWAYGDWISHRDIPGERVCGRSTNSIRRTLSGTALSARSRSGSTSPDSLDILVRGEVGGLGAYASSRVLFGVRVSGTLPQRGSLWSPNRFFRRDAGKWHAGHAHRANTVGKRQWLKARFVVVAAMSPSPGRAHDRGDTVATDVTHQASPAGALLPCLTRPVSSPVLARCWSRISVLASKISPRAIMENASWNESSTISMSSPSA